MATTIFIYVEFVVSVIHLLALLIVYRLSPGTSTARLQYVYGLVFLINTIVTVYITNYPVKYCSLWYLQGSTFNIAEALVDYIFFLRIYVIETNRLKKNLWLAAFWILDAIPRVISLAAYQTSSGQNDTCSLALPTTIRLFKSISTTIFVLLVGVSFAYFMTLHMRNTGAAKGILKSLTITSCIFGFLLCFIRIALYIPYVLELFGSNSGLLIQIEMILLAPILFFSVQYSKSAGSRSTKSSTNASVYTSHK